MKKLKHRIFEIINKAENGDTASSIFDWMIMSLIALSILTIILDSFQSIHDRFQTVFQVFEVITVIVFTLEYILRIWTADLLYPDAKHPRLKYCFSFMAIIDLLAILPFYLPFFSADLRFLRMMRLFRLFRLLYVFYHKIKRADYSMSALFWSILNLLFSFSRFLFRFIPKFSAVKLIRCLYRIVGRSLEAPVRRLVQTRAPPHCREILRCRINALPLPSSSAKYHQDASDPDPGPGTFSDNRGRACHRPSPTPDRAL